MSSDTFTNALGITRPESQYGGAINRQIASLEGDINNPMGGVAVKKYQGMANQALGNTLAGIAQAKGLNPSAAATMSDIAGSRMQGQAAQNAGELAAQEQLNNRNLLTGLLANQQQTDLAQQNAQAARLGKTVAGLAGAGANAGFFGDSMKEAMGGGSGLSAGTDSGLSVQYKTPNLKFPSGWGY